MDIRIVFRDDALLVVEKPPGMPSQPDKTGVSDLQTVLRESFGENLHAVHRLDRPVGGLMAFAREETVGRMARLLADGKFEKEYLAVACGKVEEGGKLSHWLLKNERLNLTKAVPQNTRGAKEALLFFEPMARACEEADHRELTLVKVRLVTGRHHQIRAQFAQAGFPLWGDVKYNPAFLHKSNVGLALYAWLLSFPHPITGEALSFRLTMPEVYPFSLFSLLSP